MIDDFLGNGLLLNNPDHPEIVNMKRAFIKRQPDSDVG